MIDINLNGYNDDRVRQKYLWIEKELERISSIPKGKALCM